MCKTKIPRLSYNAMFKAIFSNNKVILSKLVQSILEYTKLDIDIKNKELIIRNNELPLKNYKSKQLICDYIIKLDEDLDLNIEINNSYYPGMTERNMTYSFKIYYEHFKAGDTRLKYNKYNLLQVNFNNFKNPNDKTINMYYIIDKDDINNMLSKNLCIVNIDIASCFNLVYNKTKLTSISSLERLAAILYCEYLEDISKILGGDILTMNEKEKLLNDIKLKASDEEIQESLRFEDDIEYRFDLVEEDALERGIQQGIEQERINTIISMSNKNIDLNTISDITGKTIKEIENIINSQKNN